MLDTRFPRPLGDIGSPATWVRAGIPARFITVPGASARRVVQTRDPELLGPFVDASRSLAHQGARLITTSCGFLAAWQAELQAALNAALDKARPKIDEILKDEGIPLLSQSPRS